MKDVVMIKSFSNGIRLHLNAECPFEQIIDEVAFKFSEAKNFFGRSSMALAVEGRELSDAEEIQILETIRRNSKVNIVCIVGHDEATDKNFIKALHKVDQKFAPAGDEGQFYKGSLKDGQVIETEESIVILGDIQRGCSVISAKSIIVLGGLYGEAYAGGNGKEGAYIVALEMEPERLKIGDFKYKSSGKTAKWGIRPKVQPKIAYVKNQKIVFDALTKDLLGAF
ncbi:MAG: septum site-determining protein MinC [Lachnospiraceae bacterium]|nr:septum site-determining protein MinC [Lachnospiraceae bacterium]